MPSSPSSSRSAVVRHCDSSPLVHPGKHNYIKHLPGEHPFRFPAKSPSFMLYSATLMSDSRHCPPWPPRTKLKFEPLAFSSQCTSYSLPCTPAQAPSCTLGLQDAQVKQQRSLQIDAIAVLVPEV